MEEKNENDEVEPDNVGAMMICDFAGPSCSKTTILLLESIEIQVSLHHDIISDRSYRP